MLPNRVYTTYDLEVPSTGEKVKFRPFTVKEEKALLIARQSEELGVMVNTLREIIKSCTNGKLDADRLAIFDLEYILARIRAKSVGENVRLEFECDKDATHPKTVVDIDLTKIEVVKPEGHSTKIPLYEDVGVVMKYPDISMLDTLLQIQDDPNVSFGIVHDCIDYIYDSKEIHHASEQKEDDMIKFLDGLLEDEFAKIEQFFRTMPKFSHTVEYTCPECGTKHVKNIEGFSSFF